MRLEAYQIDFLKQIACDINPTSKLFLFGSRVDDTQKGGDIDIVLLTKKRLPIEQKWEIKNRFCKKFGQQRLDIINFSFDQESNFKNLILQDAIKL